MSRVVARLRFALAALAVALLLPGCVTTTEPSFKADKQQEVQRRVEAATAYLRQGNSEQAVNHLRRALELDPNSAAVHDTLAQVFWKTGEYELAEEHFRRAIGSDPKFSRARNNYAAFLYERGDSAGAIKQLELVIADTLYDARAAAFMNLGRAYLKEGEAAKAEESLTRAVKLDQRQWQAMLELADINYARQDYVQASRYYDQFRRYARRQSPRSLLLGIRLAQQSGNRDAQASYTLQLKSMYPDSKEHREISGSSGGR